MIPQPITKEFSLPDGRKVTIETGKLAKQADGAVVVSMGDAKLLATVVSDKDAKEGTDFLPLTVDYQEKFASAGKIPGGFLKREGRLSDYEVLICRLIDRALRPMFPGDYHANTQIMVSLISADKDVLPDALAGFAASAALMVSDIPFQGPTAHVRVGRVDGNFIISPTPDQLEKSDIDMVVAGSEENLVMVEGEMDEVGEQDMIDALMQAHEAIKLMCKAQKELESAAGKTQKREYNHEVNDLELKEKLHKEYYDKYFEVAKKANPDKKQRSEDFSAIVDSYMETLPEDTDDLTKGMIKGYFHDIQKEACRNLVLELNNRLDGRQLDEIRPIWTEVSYLPSAHGSAVFTRGETQSLTTVTLGTKYDEQMIDSAMFSGSNKFILHYNFPAFSTGEARPNRGPGRREVGHGNLAMRALKKVVPADEDNPYTIRVVSDILESNGSSSMATVCAGSMALMDAGIKIAAPVSGIAMGLISDPKTGKYAVLSDILGDEDHLGDMDFKVTGTEKGITACQMDMKVEGLSKEILTKALEQSTRGRMHILGEMKKTIATPREDLKPSAPRFAKVNIDKDMVGTLIGPGGKVIQEMQRETDTTIVVEEIPGQDKALVSIFAQNQESMELAVQRVKGVAGSATVGEVYEGEVKGIVPFGAFIEYMPGRQGLLHISEIKWERVENVEDVFKIGDKVEVKLLDIDSKTGKAKLSRKVLLPKPEGQTSA